MISPEPKTPPQLFRKVFRSVLRTFFYMRMVAETTKYSYKLFRSLYATIARNGPAGIRQADGGGPWALALLGSPEPKGARLLKKFYNNLWGRASYVIRLRKPFLPALHPNPLQNLKYLEWII